MNDPASAASAPLRPSADSPPPGWLSAAQAAEVLGVAKRTVLMRIKRGAIRAILIRGAWHVDPTCTPELRVAGGAGLKPVPTPAIAGDVLAGLSAGKRQVLARRYDICRAYRAALGRRAAATPVAEFRAAWIDAHNRRHPPSADCPQFSARTLMRWLAALDRDGIRGLVDKRRGPGGRRASWSPEARELFEGLYLTENRRAIPRLYEIMAAIAADEGWDVPCLRTVQAHCQKVLDPKLKILGREGKTAFDNKCGPHITRDWTMVPAMGCWVGDHRQFDVLIPHEVEITRGGVTCREWKWHRPWITCYIDARSWKPVAWAIDFDAPDGQRTMGCFVAGVEDHGAPGTLYLDNGKDFRMNRFAGGRPRGQKGPDTGKVKESHVKPILDILGVESKFALPFYPQSKIIEPFFRLVAEHFDKTFETYWGNRADNKPERVKKLQSLRGTAAKWAARGTTIENFRQAFEGWLTADYELRKSPSKAAGGLSPLRAFHELRAEGYVPRRPPIEDLALLLMPSQRVCVYAEGVYVRAFGRHYWSDDLEDRRCGSGRDLRRKVVYRYKPDDPSRIFVFDAESDRFLCVALPRAAVHPLATEDADREVLGEQIGRQRRLAKGYGKQLRDKQDLATNKLLAAAEQSARKLKLLDDPATIAAPAAPVVKLGGEITRAAAAGREQAKQKKRSGPTITEWYRTGTDDCSTDDLDAGAAPQGPGINALDFLDDGSTPGHGGPLGEPDHEADPPPCDREPA